MPCNECSSESIDFSTDPPECQICGSTDLTIVTGKEYEGFDFIAAHADYPCLWCEKEIKNGTDCYRRNNNMRFCSDVCIDEWMYMQDLKAQGIVAHSKVEGECNQCNAMIPKNWYHWYDRDNKYCSEECYDEKKKSARQPSGKFGTGKCVICGEDYPKMTTNQKYCSSRCYRKSQQKNWSKKK